jgi:hypothetical protein
LFTFGAVVHWRNIGDDLGRTTRPPRALIYKLRNLPSFMILLCRKRYAGRPSLA